MARVRASTQVANVRPCSPVALPQPADTFDAENAITLHVGKVQKKTMVHGSYITRNSPFFSTALKKAWVEGQIRVIRLPTKEHIAYYLDFIYNNKLPTEKNDVLYPPVCYNTSFVLLSRLYVL
jgi:hypothetical protein